MYSCPSSRAAIAISVDRRAAVARDRVHVQVAAQVVRLDEQRERSIARRRQLAAILPQLGRDVAHPQAPVDVAPRSCSAASCRPLVLDSVLAHMQAALTACSRSAALCAADR